ncbi:MAG TPA: PP2C family protein-serine/threonine phosphatase, partial [Acidimicrobiales bacterium]|nr:PP2C family protein-serine/threonine phosphatase [Acidimicrobiales bacterium]
ATDHAVVASGPPELLSLGQNVEKMRQRVRDDYDEIRLLRRVSETLQQSVLPSVLATPDRYEIAARYQPGVAGLDVGGDWFNLSDVGGGRVFFAVGDVSGRGLQAASLMAELRYAIKAYAAENPSPEDVLRRVGRYSKLSDHGHFATVLCGLFDISAGSVTMASAGHPTPILTNGEEGATVVSMAVGPPIGLNHDAYTSTRLPARRGSTLLVYTDGLVERRTEPITDSIDRLRQAASVNLPLEGLIDHLLASMVPDGARDDIVILGVRWQS